MRTEEIKINVPEGYEIDKENSTFECIKFKSKKDISNLTYKNVCKSLFPNDEGYYTNTDGDIVNDYIGGVLEEPNNAPNRKQLERLLALNKLMNIAYYYNGKQYMRVGHYIGYDKLKDVYFVEDLDNNFTQAAEITALFMYAKDAQAVINNPNFRGILDTLCK